MERAYGSTEKDMVARMHDVNAPYLLDEDGNKMTHMMASGDGYVFPTIQRNDNGDLEDYGNTDDWGAERAIERNDTLQFRLPTLAEYFSENYKTHLDNPNMRDEDGDLTDENYNDDYNGNNQDDKVTDEQQIDKLKQEYESAVRNRKEAWRKYDEADEAYFDYAETVWNRNGWAWYKDPKARKLVAAQNSARDKVSSTTKEYCNAGEKLAKATLLKYAGTSHDPMGYQDWSSSEASSRKYLIDGNIRESAGAQEVADFFNSYVNSNGFQRIVDNQAKWGHDRHPYRRIYDFGNYGRKGFTRSAEAMRKTLKESPMTTDGVFDMSLRGELGFNYTNYNPYNHIIINTAGNPFENQYKVRYPYWDTLTHEMLHDYNFIGGGQGEALDQNTNTEPGHDSQRIEKHSDLEALRFMLFKEGIYDSRGEENVTPEQVGELRKLYPKLRQFEQMTDEQAAWMLNHVADTSEKVDMSNIAANGGGLESPFKKPLPEVRYDDGGLTYGSNKYGLGSWLKGLFGDSDESPQKENKKQIYGEYIPEVYKQYYSKYKNYDDWKKRRKNDAISNYADVMARYYYNNDIDPRVLEFFKLRSGPYQDYITKRSQYEKADKYDIDFNIENSYRLKSLDKNGKPTNKHTLRIVPELLDYIYDEAIRGGTDPKSAIAVAVNESNLGNARAKDGKINLFDLFSFWAGTSSIIYPNSQVIDPYNKILNKIENNEQLTDEDSKTIANLYKKYSTMSDRIHEYNGDNVVADATKYFLAGKYAGGSKEANDKYKKLVMSRFDELMNDPRFVKWWESKNNSKK
jgi:hypothetical protein